MKSCMICKRTNAREVSICVCGHPLEMANPVRSSEVKLISFVRWMARKIFFAISIFAIFFIFDKIDGPKGPEHCDRPSACLGAAEVSQKYGSDQSALVALERMCDQGVYLSCRGLATMVGFNVGPQRGILSSSQDFYLEKMAAAAQKNTKWREELHRSESQIAKNQLIYLLEEENNPKDHLRVLKVLSKLGDPFAQTEIAQLQLSGSERLKVKKNTEAAIVNFEKAVTAGFPWAAHELGSLYFVDGSSAQKLKLASRLLSQACEADISESCILLGEGFTSGKLGVPIDIPLALQWYSLGVKLGNCDALAGAAMAYLKLEEKKKREYRKTIDDLVTSQRKCKLNSKV